MPNQWTNSRDIEPYPLFEEVEFSIDTEHKSEQDFMLIPSFSGRIAKNWFVIVETYDHKNFGKVKREYLKQFSEEERKTISRWYPKLYRWYMQTGTPNRFSCSLKTFGILNKAAAFFASI